MSLPICPYCDGENPYVISEGINVQRYRCRLCFTNFSEATSTVWHKTHIPIEKRERVEEAYELGLSERKAAEYADVSRPTISRAFKKFRES